MPKVNAAKLTADLPFGPVPKVLRRLTRPERRVTYRVLSSVLDGTIRLPEGFFDGAELVHCHAAAQKIELKRRWRS